MPNAPDTPARALGDLVTELRKERGISQDDLAFEARKHGAGRIVGSDLSKVFRGTRPYSLTLLEAIAAALDVPPSTFPQYRLAAARRLFDEEQVGLAHALENVSELERMLEEGALQPLDTAVEQASQDESRTTQRPRPAARRRTQRPTDA